MKTRSMYGSFYSLILNRLNFCCLLKNMEWNATFDRKMTFRDLNHLGLVFRYVDIFHHDYEVLGSYLKNC